MWVLIMSVGWSHSWPALNSENVQPSTAFRRRVDLRLHMLDQPVYAVSAEAEGIQKTGNNQLITEMAGL